MTKSQLPKKILLFGGLFSIVLIFLYYLLFLLPKPKNAQTSGDFDSLIQRGWALVSEDENEKAKELFQKAIQLNPNGLEGYKGLGIALQGQQKYNEAIVEFKKAIDLDSTYSPAIYGIALSLDGLNRYEEALENCVRFVKLEPSEFRGYELMTEILLSLRRYEYALRTSEITIELYPENSHIHNLKGQALTFLGRFQEAVKSLEKATTIDPNNGLAYLFWGNLLQAKIKNYFEAREKYRKALEAFKRKADLEGIKDAQKALDEIDSLIKKELQMSINNSLNNEIKMSALIPSQKIV